MGMSKEEVMKKLEAMPDVDGESIRIEITRRPYFEEYVTWRFTSLEASIGGEIIFNNNLVILMYFPLLRKFPLSSMIEMYGQPDSIIIRKDKLDGIFINTFILYQNKGVCLINRSGGLPIYDPKTFRIRASLPISSVYYADYNIPDWLYEFGCGGLDKAVNSGLIQDWNGYGRYTIPELQPPLKP